MILSNYAKIAAFVDKTNVDNSTIIIDAALRPKAIDGDIFEQIYRESVGFFRRCSLHIGSSNTQEDVDDYSLTTPDFGISLTQSQSITTTGNKINKVLTCSGTNTSGSDITINEVGIYYNMYGRNASSAITKNVLFVRQVITPITVAAGDSFSITLNWNQ